jgi:hypothetical protein
LTVRVVLLFVAVTAAVLLWRSRHGVEVWHVAADQPS